MEKYDDSSFSYLILLKQKNYLGNPQFNPTQQQKLVG